MYDLRCCVGFDSGCTCPTCCDIREEMEALLLSGEYRYDEDDDEIVFDEELALENLANMAIETPW